MRDQKTQTNKMKYKIIFIAWLLNIFLFVYVWDVIHKGISGSVGLVVGILYGCMSLFLFLSICRQWYVGFMKNKTSPRYILWPILLFLNLVILMDFVLSIASLLYS